MGRRQRKFNKKQAVRFALVAGPLENGKPTTRFQPLGQAKNSAISQSERQSLIKQISGEAYDDIEINGKKISESSEIPAFILEQIKGRQDLLFNQMGKNDRENQGEYMEGDLYEVTDENVDDDWFEDEEQGDWEDDFEDDMMEEEEGEEWESGEEVDEGSNFELKEEEFPSVKQRVMIEGKQYELTDEQIKLLDVVLPENYDKFQIEGLKFEKYNEDGLPLSKQEQYRQFLPTGEEGVVDSLEFVPEKPLPIYDNDLKSSQIVGDLKHIDDALNYEGEDGAYEELEDDFFAQMIQAEIKENKKKKKNTPSGSNFKNSSKKTTTVVQSMPTEQNKKLPQILERKSEQENIFAKYDELDEEHLEQEITDDMIEKALDDFEHNIEPIQGGMQDRKADEFEDEDELNSNNMSMTSTNYAEIENREELFGKDGELDWRCLTKREKKDYMKTKIIREFYDEVREREIDEKLKGKKNVSAEELHLKTIVKHIPFSEDHVMQRALERDAQSGDGFQEPLEYETSSDEEDITEYHQRTSVIATNLNQVTEPSKRKKKPTKKKSEELQEEMDKMAHSISQMKVVPEQRNRNETAEERKLRKQRRKEMKKQKKELKKEFAEKFSDEMRKQTKMNKPKDALHKVSYVKII